MGTAKILVIEDNVADVLLLRRGLDQSGKLYELTVLQDGSAALRFIEAQRESRATEPCVIVLDLNLPRHSGMEVLKALRTVPVMKHIQVLIVSTSVRRSVLSEIRQLGAHFREKPVSLVGFDELAAFILELCERPLSEAVSSYG